MSTELWRKSATDLAKIIREKEVSSVEVVQAHLDRIKAVNDRLNAITVVLTDEALRMAVEADKAVAAGDDLGPLHGVPVTVKENKDKGTLAEIVKSLRLITTMNLLGLPSVAAPVQVTDGLPQAVQIIGSRYREDLCLDAAEALEQRVGVFTPIDPR
jgi:Asp-tRNA(Asn)/Glu-tRNA(Gln) amidotransferase A subunit family amidase